MPSFMESLFGKKKPTSAAAGDELAKVEAELAATPGRIERAKALLGRVADLSDAEHEAALAEHAAAERAAVRLGAQADILRAERAKAEKAEAADALRKRAEALDQAIRRDYPAVAAEYEAAAKVTAEKVASLAALDEEVRVLNYTIQEARKAGLDAPEPVKTSTERYRSEPDVVEPDQEIVDLRWRFPDGRHPSVFIERNGRLEPEERGAEQYEVRRTIPGRVRKGRSWGPPQSYLVLPATRLGGKRHWPRPA